MRDRRVLAALTLLLGAWVTAVPASAHHADDHDGGPSCGSRTDAFGCDEEAGGQPGAGGDAGEDDGDGEDPAIFTLGIGTHPDTGEDCWRIVVGGTRTWQEAYDQLMSWDDNGAALDACPFDPGTPPVDALWRELRCPPPIPTPVTTDPSGAQVVGMATYLTIGGANPVDLACLGQTIVASARYVVHWGDGTVTETTSQGGDHEHGGDLTHVYATAGERTIRVEAYWSGTWNGTALPELPVPTTTTITTVVEQVQAVRDR